MKYELKRKTTDNMWLCVILVIFGAVCFLLGTDKEEAMINGAAIVLVGVGLFVYELIRDKGPVLIFDEKGFSIGDTRYSYRDIERIDSWRSKRIAYIKRPNYAKIIIDGKAVYKFDSDYENYNKFARQLTHHGVEHDLLS